MEYFIHNGKENLGPFSLSELKTQNINGNTLIWNKTMTDWVQAKELSEMSELIEKKLRDHSLFVHKYFHPQSDQRCGQNRK